MKNLIEIAKSVNAKQPQIYRKFKLSTNTIEFGFVKIPISNIPMHLHTLYSGIILKSGLRIYGIR